MPLEDDFCDIIKKARMGQAWSVEDVARMTGLPVATSPRWNEAISHRSRWKFGRWRRR